MEPIIVLKFGGSSVADNIRLNIVANKIIELKKENNNIVVVVSAQGKTTDGLIKEVKELSNLPEDREMDVLLSSGEQISMSKLSILLNRLGYPAISFTGWQAGIMTDSTNQNAKIEYIDTTRITEELNKNKIVIVAGFQGINKNNDITTLGRGGSDTTAVALASALNAKHCYIFSDVDGVYTTDPNKVTIAKKLETLTYEEMLDIAEEGAKVLHHRCIEIGEKYHIPIITKSTFNNKKGSIISDNSKIEECKIKSIVKNDDIIHVKMTHIGDNFKQIFDLLLKNQIIANHISNISHTLCFSIPANQLNKLQNLLETDLKEYPTTYQNVSRISMIGHGIRNDSKILEDLMNIIKRFDLQILNFEITDCKISIILTEKVNNDVLETIHSQLIN